MSFARFLGRLGAGPAPRPLPPAVADWGPPPLEAEPHGGDAMLQELLPLAHGRRCLLAWGDGPRVARMSVALEAAGAAATLAAHPGEVPDWATRELLDAGRALGLDDAARRLAQRAPRPVAVSGALDCDLGRPWRVGGTLASLPGTPDVVADGSQLIHWPDPLARLRALAATGAAQVVIETPLVRPDTELLAAGFRPGAVWYAVGMSASESLAMAAFWRRQDVLLGQYERFPHGFDAAEAEAAGIGTTAWWSFTDAEGLTRLLALAGLRPLRHRVVWNGRAAVMVAERVPAPGGALA